MTINMLIAAASATTYFEECLKRHMDEGGDEDNYEFDEMPEGYNETLCALERQDQDGQIAMARRVCKMLGHEYDLPEGYKDTTL